MTSSHSEVEEKRNTSSNTALAILSLSHFSQHMYEARSVLYTYIMNTLGLNYTQIGVAVAASSAMTGILQMAFSLAGRIVPRRLLLGFGNILTSVSSFGIGLSNKFTDFVSSQMAGGVGVAPQHPVGVSVISERFENKGVSTPIGIYYGLGYVGNVIGPVMLTAIALASGWRLTLFVLAVIPLATGILVLVCLRKDRFSGKTTLARANALEGGHSLWTDAKSALRVKGAVVLIAAYAFEAGATHQTIIATYVPLFLTNGLHLAKLEASFIYSLAMLGGVIGTILFGRFADTFGYLKTTMICTGLVSTSIFFMSNQATLNLVSITSLIVMGLTAFPISSLMQSALSSFSTSEQRDVLIGLYLTIGFVFSSFWSIIIGILIDMYGMFLPAWYLMSGLCVLSAGLLTITYKQRETTTK